MKPIYVVVADNVHARIFTVKTLLHIRTHHEHLFLSIVNTDSYRT